MSHHSGYETTLGAIAEQFDLELASGDPGARLDGVCALTPGRDAGLAFAESEAQADALAATGATAVILTAALAPRCPVAALVCERPRLAFARAASVFEPAPPAAGVHPSAVVEPGARVDPGASIGPQAVVGADAVLEAGVVVGPSSVIGARARIGTDTRIEANVSVGDGVVIGARVRIEANAAIGGRGFGLVHNGQGWDPIPQLGGVRIDDDVEVGAGTTIDRGAIDDTVIGPGVKLDDQVHIGHNCVIGAHTVVAGCTGIAGSCTIGAHCMIGGGVGIGDHVTVVDGVIITAASQVPKDITAAGIYSSTLRAMPAGKWRKRLALFRQLDRIERRLRRVERPGAFTGDKDE